MAPISRDLKTLLCGHEDWAPEAGWGGWPRVPWREKLGSVAVAQWTQECWDAVKPGAMGQLGGLVSCPLQSLTPASLVLRLLLQAGYDPELRDGDGWTPLHAAAHWGVEDACRLLAEHGGGMDSLTHAVRPVPGRQRVGWGRGACPSLAICPSPPPTQGQRPCDLADEEVLSLLEELARKQEDVSLGPGSSEEEEAGGPPCALTPSAPVLLPGAPTPAQGHEWGTAAGGG